MIHPSFWERWRTGGEGHLYDIGMDRWRVDRRGELPFEHGDFHSMASETPGPSGGKPCGQRSIWLWAALRPRAKA